MKKMLSWRSICTYGGEFVKYVAFANSEATFKRMLSCLYEQDKKDGFDDFFNPEHIKNNSFWSLKPNSQVFRSTLQTEHQDVASVWAFYGNGKKIRLVYMMNNVVTLDDKMPCVCCNEQKQTESQYDETWYYSI